MSDYKLVPVVPTKEMLQNAWDECLVGGTSDYREFWDAMLDAAPKAVEKVSEICDMSSPVAYAVFEENGNIRIWCADPIQAETLRLEYGDRVEPLYSTPQSTPDVSELVKVIESLLPYVVTDFAECRGDKCRELWCLSCTPEETATEAVLNAREAYENAVSIFREYQNKEGGCE